MSPGDENQNKSDSVSYMLWGLTLCVGCSQQVLFLWSASELVPVCARVNDAFRGQGIFLQSQPGASRGCNPTLLILL